MTLSGDVYSTSSLAHAAPADQTCSPAPNWSPANVSNNIGASFQQELHIAPDGTQHLVWIDETDFANGEILHAFRSPNGAWTPPINLSNTNTRSGLSDQGTALGPDGGLHVVWGEEDGRWNGYYRYRSPSGVWSPVENATAGLPSDSLGHTPAVDGSGTVHMLFQWNWASSTFGYIRKAPGGSWSAPESIWNGLVWSSSLVSESNGTLHALWSEAKNPAPGLIQPGHRLYYATRPPNGPWSTAVIVRQQNDKSIAHPRLVMDGSGALHAAWQEDNVAGDSRFIVYSTRPTGGAWAPAQVLAAGLAFEPWLAVDAAGTLHGTWLGETNGSPAIVYAVKSQGGSWTALSTTPFVGVVRTPAPSITMRGDGRAVIAWGDRGSSCAANDVYVGAPNLAPGVTKPSDQSNVEGDQISLQVVASDPDGNTTLSYSAQSLPAGLQINSTTGLISGTIASGAATGSPYTVTVTATDEYNPVSVSFSWTVNRPRYVLTVTKAGNGVGTVSSLPPGIDCGSDCSDAYDGGSQVTLTASPNSDSTFTGWSGDCSGMSTCAVSMDRARSVTASFGVANRPPVANSGSDQTVDEGASATLDASGSTDPDGDSLSYVWTIVNSSGPTISLSATNLARPTFTTADNGSYTMRVTVTDSTDSSASDDVVVTVRNVAPTATFVAPSTVAGGSNFTLALNGPSDPSPADTAAGFAYSFNCGAGYGPVGSASSATCVAPASGPLTVKGKIADKDGGTTEYTASVTVDTPAADTTPPTTTAMPSGTNGNNGWFRSAVTVALSATDNPGGSGVKDLTYCATGAQKIACKTVAGATASLSIAANGSTTITFHARDNAGNVEADKTLVLTIDKARATCLLTDSGSTPDGKGWVEFTTQDTVSGLASVLLSPKSYNMTLTVPNFQPGTTDPVVVRFTEVDPTKSALWEFSATDVAGNVLNCDPVLIPVVPTTGQPMVMTVPVTEADKIVRFTNGTPGLTSVTVKVRGRTFRADRLKPGEVRSWNIPDRVQPGDYTLEITATGSPGASARILISE
ncbi:MAG: putative Ig domain-containing protein [Chloroflexi bacterium]|nr:putative Ig domain-containing protein [Chloroflexota bacterium]